MPVVLFKMVLIQHLYGIPSLRQTVREVDMNMAYRWFLGYNFSETIPHFATVSYAFCRRYDSEIVEAVFQWVLTEVERAGFLSPEVVFVDATHIKANANLKKACKKAIPHAARVYDEQLRAEINADRAAHGKKPFDDDDRDDPPKKTVTSSTTDPERGCSTRASTSAVLPMVRTRSATGTISFWTWRFAPVTSMTARCSIRCMTA